MGEQADEKGDGFITFDMVQHTVENNEDLSMRLEALEIPIEPKKLQLILDDLVRSNGHDPQRGAPIEQVAKTMMQVKATASASDMFHLKIQVEGLTKRLDDIAGKVEALVTEEDDSPEALEKRQKSSMEREAILKRQALLHTQSRPRVQPPVNRNSLSTDVIRKRLETASREARDTPSMTDETVALDSRRRGRWRKQ